MIRRKTNDLLHLVETSVNEKNNGTVEGHLQNSEGLMELDSVKKHSEKYFEVTPSVIFQDVPEDETILEALFSDVAAKDEQFYLDGNNIENTKPMSTINSDIVEFHKLDQIHRTYSRKNSLKIPNQKYDKLKTFYFDGKSKAKSSKEKISTVDNFQIIKKNDQNVTPNSDKFINSNGAYLDKTKLPNKTVTKTNTVHSDVNDCQNLVKETLPIIEAHQSENKVLTPDELKNTPKVIEYRTCESSKYSGKESNFSKQNVCNVKFTQNPKSEEKMDTDLIKFATDVGKSKNIGSSCSSTISASKENLIQESRICNSYNNVNKSNKCFMDNQTNRTQSIPVKYNMLHTYENMHPFVCLTDYRKQYKKHIKDKNNLLKENVISEDANVTICEISGHKNESDDNTYQGSPKPKKGLKQIKRFKAIQNETNAIKGELLMENGINYSVNPAGSSVKNVLGFHKDMIKFSHDSAENVTAHTQNLTNRNKCRAFLKSVTANIEVENKNSCFQLPSVASEEKNMKEYEEVEKVSNCTFSKNFKKQNITSIEVKKNDEIPTGASNRKRLSLMDMFKRYSEKINQPSESEVFTDKQSFMQCVLGKSSKEIKETSMKQRNSQNVDSLDVTERSYTNTTVNNRRYNLRTNNMSDKINLTFKNEKTISKSVCKSPSSYRKRRSQTSSIKPVSRSCVAKQKHTKELTNKRDNCETTCKKYTKKGRPKKQIQKDCSFVAVTKKPFNNSTCNKIPLLKKKNMEGTTKKKAMTISNLLARLPANKTTTSNVPTVSSFPKKDPSFKRETLKVETDILTSSDGKLSFKMEACNSKNSVHDVHKETNAANKIRRMKNQTSPIDFNSESFLQSKRRNISAPIQPKLLNTNSGQCKKCIKKKHERKSVFDTQLNKLIFAGQESPYNDVSDQVYNTSPLDKVHTLNEHFIRYGSDTRDTVYHQNAGKLSKEAMKLLLENTLKEPNCQSRLYQPRDVTIKRKNGQIFQVKTHRKDSSHICGAHGKVDGSCSMRYQNEDSSFIPETPENINETEFVSGSDWIENEGKGNPPVQVRKQLKNSKAVSINENNCIPMVIQTSNNPVFNPVNNSLLYGNPVVPQVNNLSIYPYSNQLVVQTPNLFQNPYGVVVPRHNSFASLQPSVTVPLYQAVYKSPYLQANNFPPPNLVVPKRSDPPELNPIQPDFQTTNDSSWKDVIKDDVNVDQNNRKGMKVVVCQFDASEVLKQVTNKSGKTHSCDSGKIYNLDTLQTKVLQEIQQNVETEVSSSCVNLSNGTMVSENSVIKIPNTVFLTSKTGRKIPVKILWNKPRVTEQITIERQLEKKSIVLLDQERNIIMQRLRQNCFKDLYDGICEIFSSCENLKLSVGKFYSQPLIKDAFSNKLGEMISDFEPGIKYKFDNHFFEIPLREVMKDYVNFFLSVLYTKPDFKNNFVQRAFEKLSFRDCTYFCMSLPQENELINETDLALYLSFAALFAIFDECKQQGL